MSHGGPTTSEIIAAVAKYFDREVSTLLAEDRRAAVVHARHICAFLIHRVAGKSQADTACALRWRDHTTTINACKSIEDKILTDEFTRSRVTELCRQLDLVFRIKREVPTGYDPLALGA